MNSPYIPPQTAGSPVGPPPPPMPGAPAQQPAQVDVEAAAKQMIPTKVLFDGQPCSSPEQVQWAYDLLCHIQLGDKKAVYGYLNTTTEPFDLAPVYAKLTGIQQPNAEPAAQPDVQPATETAPPNPVSHQTAPQIPEPQEPAAEPPAPKEEAKDQMPESPHKLAAWDRLGGKQCTTLRGLKTRLKKTHKMDWSDYCAQFSLNEKTGLPSDDEPAAPPKNQEPTSPPPPAPGLPTTQQDDGTLAVAPPPAPAGSHPSAGEPIATFQPQPPAPQPQPQPQPQAPAPQATAQPQQLDLAAQLVGAAASGQFGPEAQSLVQQAGVPTAATPGSVSTPQSPPGSRVDIANLLGGPVDCVFVPLTETAGLDLSGRIDANQLVGLAEIEGLRQVTDPERLKYREDRKVAMIEFGKLLSQHPQVYVLVKGYDWVLDQNFQDILLRRVCSGGIVKGGQYLPFNL